LKTRADRTSVASAVLGAEQNPAPKAQQAEAPARPLGPSGSLAPSEQTVAAEHLGGQTMAQRALGMLHMGRMLRPAVAGIMMGVGLLSAPAQAQVPVEPESCVTQLQAASHTAPTLEHSAVTPGDLQPQVQALRTRVDEVSRRLESAGKPEAAQHLRGCMQRFAPDGAGDAPLTTLLAALSGDPDAKANLQKSFDKHGVDIQPSDKDDGWVLQAYLRSGNDNMATLFDGKYRSDDGATASLGAGMAFTRGDQRIDLDVDYQMLTERGGMDRTDLVTALLSHTKQSEAGGFKLSYGYDLGLQGTGDFGGAQVQDGWHGLNEGTMLGGRRLTGSLQNNYATDPQAALLVGVHAGAIKDLGLIDLYGGVEARTPIGPTGLGWVSGDLGVDISGDSGLYADIGITARHQWTQGSALSFDGAPLDDATVLIPHIGVGWQGDGWRVGIDWRRNDLGTKPGMGDFDSDTAMLTLTIGGGRRTH